ncbi:MAG TPA: hypothetical protein VNV66_07675 [Pilimelia sp.]|nr:hypothetical protein [Pilimelia sp.]
MSGNYWEEEVYTSPPLSGLRRSDMSATFSWLDLHFPIEGSKIDWRRVQGRHVHWKVTDDTQLAAMVSREVCKRIRRGSVVEHIGDGLSPYGVLFVDGDVTSVVTALLEIPEHHYFIAEDRSWIVVATTEGDLDAVDHLNLD